MYNYKPRPLRSEPYKQFVKSLPCVCGCGRPSDDPHHVIDIGLGGTMGGKCSDMFIIPMARSCHNLLHKSPKNWEIRHGLQALHVLRTIEKAEASGWNWKAPGGMR